MNDLIRRIDFRVFSYEEDPESVVDMQRSREVLEGGWLDSEETCRMNHKVVARTPGSSWVLAYGTTVFGYADMIPGADGTGCVVKWRLHPDFRTPALTRKLVTGLAQEARTRQYSGLVYLADTEEVLADLESIGLKRDRTYGWVQTDDSEPSPGAEATPFAADLDQALAEPLLPFLGPPLPPRFVLVRGFLASSYGVFSHSRPLLHRIRFQDRSYLGCFDGREWFVFRPSRHELDREAIKPVLSVLGGLRPSRLLMSQKAAESANLPFVSNVNQWDLFTPVPG